MVQSDARIEIIVTMCMYKYPITLSYIPDMGFSMHMLCGYNPIAKISYILLTTGNAART